uniref:Acetyl-coenzyme A carboxylase carboxyl transferase subunit alpha n=1 Tax=Gracilaria tenuistipitata var. liui TaxID=285951 RepID=ACCA_GRATL|nr:acetyl-CoA carboxylase carboxyltransferase alpha subunit [Gracilaria tenuistipitata var. liui]Q6B8M3.1 RecName: Full=Acetyl-coenzyme A carboxylase carboxyl transferase subunit alpha; Short=ACCase subunit alpha; Short=Acetyl-CoA carboxylase carboxyltransferase subunit alpha [Gracilaria tenuistipitata var. liui]AAT79762.1 acetyl-CoA carboxylase carboxytransferase alpha subunit [Gracilaria tenuistipitata var. liui]
MTIRKALSLDFLKPILELEYQIQQLSKISTYQQVVLDQELVSFKEQLSILKYEVFQSLTPLQRLHLVRQADRPTTLDYIPYIMSEWLELHGDRGGKDDPALVGGIGKLNNYTVIFVGHQRGKDTKDNVLRNFGMASPGGYRKALRLMQHANQFNFPILTFIDTPGAWAGIDAETLGQGEAIAVNLREMFSFDVPIICTILGEGGSGGALGIGIGDKILMLEYAVYTVATPEACAAILWKDSKRSLDAAEALKITSADLKVLGVIDKVVKEPIGGSQSNPSQAAYILKESLISELHFLTQLLPSKRKNLRYSKFRKIGTFYEGSEDYFG